MDKLKLQNEKHDKYVDKTCGKKEKKSNTPIHHKSY
jgi:hypothetical protein